ncbi:MAG: hypothetical protein V8S58_05095 [Lachnospiraceae bacterium]
MAESAAKQSRRSLVPQDPVTLKEAFAYGTTGSSTCA